VFGSQAQAEMVMVRNCVMLYREVRTWGRHGPESKRKKSLQVLAEKPQ
jgi:hypothetical protein